MSTAGLEKRRKVGGRKKKKIFPGTVAAMCFLLLFWGFFAVKWLSPFCLFEPIGAFLIAMVSLNSPFDSLGPSTMEVLSVNQYIFI